MIESFNRAQKSALCSSLLFRQRHIWVCFAASLLSISPPASRAQSKEISGTWVAKTQTPMGDLEIVYELKVGNGKITGSQKLPFGDAPIVASKIDGDHFELTVELESFGDMQKATAKGKIVGDTLEITPAFPKPPEAAGGPSGPPPIFSGPLVFHRGKPTPSNRAPALDYNAI